MDCAIEWRNRFINSTRNFFICLKMFIMQQRKSIERCEIKVAKTGIASAATPSYNKCIVSNVCFMTRLIQNQNQ